MGRVRKTIDCGNIRFISNFIAPMLGNHKKREERSLETSERVKKINEIHKIDYCEAMFNTNFSPGDLHIALTYDDEHYIGVDEERALKDRRNFIKKLRRRCKKLYDIDIKYCTMTEQGIRSDRWHHHFVLPRGTKEKPIEYLLDECWEKGRIRILNTLYKDGNFRGLAEYYVDKTKGGQKEDTAPRYKHKYSFSRNCAKPIVTYETDLSEKWRSTPLPPLGWQLKPDSLFNDVDSFGYAYQKYTLIRINDLNTEKSNGGKAMGNVPAYSKDVKAEIYKEYCKGVKQDKLALDYHISKRTIQRYIASFRPARVGPKGGKRRSKRE